MLGGDQGRDHAQEALQLVPTGQRRQPLGAPGEDRDQIGQANGIALGELAQRVLAEVRSGTVRLVAQD
jgi:hypothetical protein